MKNIPYRYHAHVVVTDEIFACDEFQPIYKAALRAARSYNNEDGARIDVFFYRGETLFARLSIGKRFVLKRYATPLGFERYCVFERRHAS